MTKKLRSMPKGKPDSTRSEALASQKGFKGAKDVRSEWLTKRNSVNQTHEAPKSY